MPFGIYKSDVVSARSYFNNIVMVKTTQPNVPQLFIKNKPIFHTGNVINFPSSNASPRVTSTNWCVYTHNPTSVINGLKAGQNIFGYKIKDDYYYLPSLYSSKIFNKSSGLTTSLENVNNGLLDNVAIRINRSSISTNYLNVFKWAYCTGSDVWAAGEELEILAQWGNTTFYDGESSNEVYGKYISNDGLTANINNRKAHIFSAWGTIAKNNSYNYLHILAPVFRNPDNDLRIWGYGIILQPTNTNSYPTST